MQHAISRVLPWMASHSPHKKRPNTIPVFSKIIFYPLFSMQ
ncbi:hypothetical protein HMPREF3212_01005 [Citrobacter freundii]|nr:hypothetical protein HMPREF3212_01005 [Citrobacter freundii]